MPPFTESFWTEDYITGLNRLYSKLQQGITEDEELLTLARKRADAEEAHGLKLQSASRDTMKKDGFAKDDGASTRKAFDGMLQETEDSGKSHIRISQNLHTMVLKPFARWSSEHANRVTSSHSDVTTKVKAHERQFNDVKKLRNTYFNKCRLLEDYEEEHKFAFPAHEGVKSSGHDTPTKSRETAASTGVQEDGEEEPIELGDVYYTESQMKSLLATMLDEIPRKEVKIPILGIFQNVSNGEAIVRWIQENMQLQSLGEAERVGQDLISTGHLRYLGVGNTFANSSVLNFQWKDKSLIAAGKQADLEKGLLQKATAMPYVGEYVLTYVANDYPNETPLQKLTREAAQSNETYKRAVQKLDKLRTDLEASIFEHLKYMERCEYDRLRALKAVMMDMSAAISNVKPGMKSSMDNMLLYKETISPDGDLRYMLESYRTGPFAPKVVTYENYYNVADEQTFGVDLEMKARQDRKRVPNIVASFLGFMDEQYPLLKSDEGMYNSRLVVH